MKTKYTLMLFCVTLTLGLFMLSCADTSKNNNGSNTNGGGDNGSNTNGGGDTTEKEFSNVSAESCGDSTLELNCFISVWNTENSGSGSSDSTNVVLPLVSDGTYNFYVDWGDDTGVEYITNASAATHKYKTEGERIIHIAGEIKGWRFYSSDLDFGDAFGDAIKLLDVTQWGSLSLGNTAGGQFQGASNFNPTATDAPDLSDTIDLNSAFSNANSFNAPIGHWDVSKVRSMRYMFRDASAFNNGGKPLGWGNNTGNVTNMQRMFASATNFNQDISGWYVRNVTNMTGMFANATSFNNNSADFNWADKTSKVTNMTSMFEGATAFNIDISGWNVGNVSNMTGMFSNATSFNNNSADFNWADKTSNVTDMHSMFKKASNFNQNISGWDVGNVTSYDDFAMDSGLELNNIPFRFRGLDTISKEICDANPLTNCFISTWNTANDPTDPTVTGYSGIMSVKLPLVSEGTYNFYVDWGDESDVQNITNYSDATHTYDTAGDKTIHIAGTIKGWRFYVKDKSFGDAAKLTDVSQWGSLSLGNTEGRQFQGAGNFNPTATDAPDLSDTIDLNSAFRNANSFNAPIGHWDVSKIINMESMFNTAIIFNQDISDWDVGQVTTMKAMFFTSYNFNNGGKALNWGDKTSNVTNMSSMFSSAVQFNQDISDWDVGEVTTMKDMFNTTDFNNGGKALNWGDKTSKVTNMSSMFALTTSFNQDISAWNVENVTSYDGFDLGSGLELNNIPFKFRGLDTISKEICDVNPLTNCFISVWNTGNVPTETNVTGYSGTMSVKLPLVSEGTYNFYVDWGDGAVQHIKEFDPNEITHTYNDAGEKTIHIAGTIKGWRFYVEDDNYGDAAKLLDVKQWGSLSLGNTAGRQFISAENFNPTATDAPDISETTSLTAAFARASSFNGKIGNWDVSKITDMSFMFQSFNPFNQDVSDWDVGNVTNMVGMFNAAVNFNNDGKPLNWGDKTSNVTSMASMFWSADKFNQDISGWDVSKVSNMQSMFYAAGSFNNGGKDFKWEDKTSNVTDMEAMFASAYGFNQDIGGWHVGKVTTMAGMFEDASVFNQNISGWNVENVEHYNNFATGSALTPEHTPSKFKNEE